MIKQPVSRQQKARITLLKKANKLRLKKEYKAAIETYADIIKQFGESVELAVLVASCYFVLGFYSPQESDQNFEHAIRWMEKAVRLSPSNARLHADLAQYYWLGMLDYERALEEYRRALELNPNEVRALVGAAALYGVPEEVVTLDEAINWLERATQLEPDEPRYHFRLGEFYQKAARPLDAEREWIKSLLCPEPLPSGSDQVIQSMEGEL